MNNAILITSDYVSLADCGVYVLARFRFRVFSVEVGSVVYGYRVHGIHIVVHAQVVEGVSVVDESRKGISST